MSGVAATLGVVPAGSAHEHVVKPRISRIPKVPISLCYPLLPLRRGNIFTWGSAFFTHFPSYISEIHSKTAPPSLPPPHLQTHPTPAVQPTFFIWQGQNTVTGQGIICSSLSLLFNTAGCLLTAGKLLLILLRRWT